MRFWERLINALRAIVKKRLETTPVSFTTSTRRTGYVQPDVQAFVNRIRPPALEVEASYGIPWRFAMAQAAHESRYGLSGLTVEANNLFGFTAGSAWVKDGKPVVTKPTHEMSALPPEKIIYWETPGDILSKIPTPSGGTALMVSRAFRKYATWYDSLMDWASLVERKFPRAHLAARAGDFPGFAKALEDGNYATDRDPRTGERVYAKKLIQAHSALEGIA